VAQPHLRLVDNDRGNHVATIARTPDESPRIAVMAWLSAVGPGNGELLRKAQSAAREIDGEFYAVMVDPSRARFGKAQVRTLIDDAILASYCGAKIVWLESSDAVGELLELARKSHVGRIFVSRNQPTAFSRLFRRGVYSDLLSRGKGFRIDVVGFEHDVRRQSLP
jgi:K+-sensing histidine kinase KdpD